MGANHYYAAAATAPTGWNPLHSPILPKPNKLPTYSKRMRQLWREVEGAAADVTEEAADAVAVDDVEAWGFNPPHLKTTITKEARRLPQARPPRGGEGTDAEAADMGTWKTHTKMEYLECVLQLRVRCTKMTHQQNVSMGIPQRQPSRVIYTW